MSTRVQPSWSSPMRMVLLPGDEFAAPEQFTARIADDALPYSVEIECRVDADGHVKVTSCCMHAAPGDHLTASTVRDTLAIRRWGDLALASATFTRSSDGSLGLDVEPDVRSIGLTQPRARKRSMTDPDQLQRVADAWEASIEDGESPVKGVARRLSYSASQAQRLVTNARKAGLIPEGLRR